MERRLKKETSYMDTIRILPLVSHSGYNKIDESNEVNASKKYSRKIPVIDSK